MCFIKYNTVVNENWKHKQNSSFWFAGMESEKADIVLKHRLLWKCIQKQEDII